MSNSVQSYQICYLLNAVDFYPAVHYELTKFFGFVKVEIVVEFYLNFIPSLQYGLYFGRFDHPNNDFTEPSFC